MYSNEEIAQAALGTLQKWTVRVEVRTRDAFTRTGSYPNWDETFPEYISVEALTRFTAEKKAINEAKKLGRCRGKIIKVRVLRIAKEGEFKYEIGYGG